jgi:hypothetical protein
MEVYEFALAIFLRIDTESSQVIKACLPKANYLNIFSDENPLFLLMKDKIKTTYISYMLACQKADKKTRLNYCGKKDTHVQ